MVCVHVDGECATGNNLSESIIPRQLRYQPNPQEDRQRAVIGWPEPYFMFLNVQL